MKPKATSQQQKKSSTKAGDIDPSEIQMFLVGSFGLLAGFMGEHWIIREDEADQIADPLCRILNKQAKKRKDQVNAMMAPMLLTTAIGAIVIPRVMISIEEWRYKREQRKQLAIKQQLPESRIDPRKTSGYGAGVESEAPRFDQPTIGQESDDQDRGHVIPTVPSSLALQFGE